MTQINQLPLLSNPSPGDQIPVFSPNNGDSRRLPIGSLLQFFQQTFSSPEMSTNFYTPSTGFNIAVPTPTSAMWILIQPASTISSGTVTLPLNTVTPDGTEILVTSTQTITTFALAANGATAIYGAPSSMTAGDHFRVRYFLNTNSWYVVG